MDVNGNKSPNRIGQDVQSIIIYKKTIEPTYQKMMGSDSFKNILHGNDEFIYTDYKIGETPS